jgi:hypothetical protein
LVQSSTSLLVKKNRHDTLYQTSQKTKKFSTENRSVLSD